MSNEVEIHVVIDDASVDPSLAALRSKIGAWAKTLPTVSLIGFDSGRVDSQLSMLKSKLQAHRIADLLDVNLNAGQIESQLLYLKRKIEAYKIGDFLDINLNAGQMEAQLASLQRDIAQNAITIPVSLDVDMSELIALESMTLSMGITGGSGGSAALGILNQINKNTADTSADLMQMVALGIETNSILSSGFDSVVRAINNTGDMLSHDLIMMRMMGGGSGGKVIVPPTGGGGGGGGGGRWGWFGFLGGTGIAGVATWHIVLDALLETFIAVVSAMAAFAVGAAALQPTFSDIYHNIVAINTVNSALGDQIPVLGSKFSNLSSSTLMAARGVAIYGGAVTIANKDSGILSSVAMRVTSMFDTWIAKIVVWNQTSQTFGKILTDGVGFLHQFGQAAGFVGDAIFNLIKAMPGVAHYLMDIFVAGAHVLDIFTKIPTPMLAVVLALHGLYVWGRLGIGVLLTMGNRLGIVSKAALDSYRGMSALALIRNPFTWAVAAGVGLAFFIHRVTEVDPAVTKMMTGMENELGKLPASQLFAALSADVATLQEKLSSVKMKGPSGNFLEMFTPSANWEQAWHKFTSGVTSFFVHGFAPPAIFGTSTQHTIEAMNAEITKMEGSGHNLYATLGSLQNRGYAFSVALGIMNLAGVKWNDTEKVMLAKVDNLITGWKQMGVQGALLANSVNAVNFATLQQNSKITTLTQGWTAFFGTLISGEQGFTSFVQAIQTLNPALAKVHGNLTGLSANSLTARTDFLAAAQAAQTQANTLMTMAAASNQGAKGTQMVTQAVKDMVARMLPAAKGSQAMTTILYGLAQQGGYRAANSFKSLSQWADNVKHPLHNLDNITTILTGDMGNLTTDVKNLSVALGTNLTQAEASAINIATNATTVFDTTAKALYNDGVNSKAFHNSLQPLATMLVTNSVNAQQAHDRFDAFMIMMGLSRGAADKLWASLDHVSRSTGTARANAQSAASMIGGALLRALQEVAKAWRISLTETGTGHFSITGPGGTVAGPGGKFQPGGSRAAGGYIGMGTGPTSDDVMLLASKGEFMVNAHATRKNRWLLEMINAGKFAGGGLVGLPPDTTDYKNSFQSMMTATMEADMTAAMKADIAAARAAAAAAARSSGGHAGPGGGAPAANAALAHRLYASQLTPASWAAWNDVAMMESGWNQFARNPSSGAYGIAQALPPTKYPFAGQAAGGSNPTAQITWMWNYMKGRYGGPLGAEAHELAFHWYGKGLRGGLFNRPTLIGVGERGTERVDVTPVGKGGGTPGVTTFEVVPGGQGLFEAFMAQFIRKFIRVRGGDVQNVLGRL